MAPNPDKKRLNENTSQEEVTEDMVRQAIQLRIWRHFGTAQQADDSGSSDSEVEEEPQPLEMPFPQIWHNLGYGCEMLLNFLPSAFEKVVLHNFYSLFDGEAFGQEWHKPQDLTDAQESQIVKDFYTRGFRYHGQCLSWYLEVDCAIEDFVGFFDAIRARRENRLQNLPKVLWSNSGQAVTFYH